MDFSQQTILLHFEKKHWKTSLRERENLYQNDLTKYFYFLKYKLTMENMSPVSSELQPHWSTQRNASTALLQKSLTWIFWWTVLLYFVYIAYKFYLHTYYTISEKPQEFVYFEIIIKYGGYLTLLLTGVLGFHLWKNRQENGSMKAWWVKGILVILTIISILFWYQGPRIDYSGRIYFDLLNKHPKDYNPTGGCGPGCAIGRPFRSRKWFRRWSHEAELVKWGGWVLSKSSV